MCTMCTGLYSKCVFHRVAFKSLYSLPLSYLTSSHLFSWLAPYVPICLLLDRMSYFTHTLLLIEQTLLGKPLPVCLGDTYSLAFDSLSFPLKDFFELPPSFLPSAPFSSFADFVMVTKIHHCTSWPRNTSKYLCKAGLKPYSSPIPSAYCRCLW